MCKIIHHIVQNVQNYSSPKVTYRAKYAKLFIIIVPQVGLSGQPGAVRGMEPKVWRGRILASSPEEYAT